MSRKQSIKAGKGVVGITNIQTSNFWSNGRRRKRGVGSGVIYKKAGDAVFIVTNHHVVEGATELEVTLADGTKVAGDLAAEVMFGQTWLLLKLVLKELRMS